MEEKYQEALALYNQCDYEGAYTIIIDNGLCSTEKGDFLCNECRKQILQQYIYLIKDYIAQEMYIEAKDLRQQYYSLYGFSSDLSSIVIPEPVLQDEIEETSLPEQKVIKELPKEDTTLESRPNRIKVFFIWGIGIMILGIIGYLMLVQSSDNDKMNSQALTVQKDSPQIANIKSDPNKLVLHTNIKRTIIYYVEINNYVVINDESSYENIIYKYDAEKNITEKISCDNIKCTNGTEVLFDSFDDIRIKDDKIILIGEQSFKHGLYYNVVRFHPSSETFQFVFDGTGFLNLEEDRIVFSRQEIIKYNDKYGYADVSESYDEYYGYDGAHIDGYTIQGKGKIDKYDIYLYFHSLDNKITGYYKYEGHDNYMTIKGKLQNNQFVFTEYDEKGNAFATFKGDVDFEKQLLVGTFYRNNSELNFWVYNEDDLRSCVEAWNYIHTPYLGNCANYTDLYGESVSFYGRTFTSKQCVEHFLTLINKYDSYSQKIVSEINYTSIDDNTIRCDFTKGVEFNGKYKEYEAYLVLHRRNEYSPWKIIVESDKTTDYNLNKRRN